MTPARAPLDGGRLRALREEKGLSQHDLARAVGVAGGERVSRWELGTSVPRPQVLVRVAEALGVGVADLLEIPDGDPGLRELRLAAGLTLEELATKVHVTTRTVHRWELGEVRTLPAGGVVELLSHALGVGPPAVSAALRASQRRDS